MSNPNQKRMKIPLNIRANPVGGTMSASANAEAQKNSIFINYIVVDRKTDNFVARHTDDVFGDIAAAEFCALTNDDGTKETEYRDFFYSTLVTHDQCINRVTILPIQEDTSSYTEATMGKLLPVMYDLTCDAFGCQKSTNDGNEATVHTVEHGLLISNDSRPDLVVAAKDNFKTIRIGEFKNASGYSTRSGANQCFSYLCCMMYHYRAVRNLPLESVYGFSFCGPQCQGLDDEYAVGLLKVSAPKHLGENFLLEQSWKRYSTGNLEGVKDLLFYLTHGNSWDKPAKSPMTNFQERLPALFNTPSEYWEDIVPLEASLGAGAVRELQHNGTSAIVFRLNSTGMREIFQSMVAKGTGGISFANFVNEVNAKQEALSIEKRSENTTVEITKGGEERYYYVKFRVSDTSPLFNNIILNTNRILKFAYGMNMMNHPIRLTSTDTIKIDVWKDIRDLYIVSPYDNDNFMCIVMAEVMGQPLVSLARKINEREMIELLTGLQLYMDELIANELFHGDFLPHNCFYNTEEKRISVIDFDEGCFSKIGPVPLRLYDIGKNAPSSFYLRYPNALRNDCEMYTNVQYVSCVLQLLGCYDVLEAKIEDLELQAENFAALLRTFEEKNSKDAVVTDSDQINELSESILLLHMCIKAVFSTVSCDE